jgi:hypothetical protein
MDVCTATYLIYIDGYKTMNDTVGKRSNFSCVMADTVLRDIRLNLETCEHVGKMKDMDKRYVAIYYASSTADNK